MILGLSQMRELRLREVNSLAQSAISKEGNWDFNPGLGS